MGFSASPWGANFSTRMVADGGPFNMQCPSCRAVYSNGLSLCPRCKTPAPKASPEAETTTVATPQRAIQDSVQAPTAEAVDESSHGAPQAPSTLIEFPGVSRVSRPQWRKELS